MATPITNLGLVTVDGAYSNAATSVALVTGDGSKLPDTTGGYTYPLTWWNATDYAHPADDPFAEIVLVTSRSTDTLSTIVRAQEGTSASAKNSAGKTYRMSLGVTKLMWESLHTPKDWHQGLQLQTHRDSDLAPYQVELVDVDSLIMDDGVELRNDSDEWTGKVADITVSGAGGLDSGTEEASILYEIYAIAKEDATRNLLLHKSKLWSGGTGYPNGDDATQGIRSDPTTHTNDKVAQGFTFNGGIVPYVEAMLVRVGTPTGKIWFTIETNNAGNPSGTVVATSYAYDVSRIPVSALDIRFPMKASQSLSASPTLYHLVAQGDWTRDGSNHIGWRYDGSTPDYTSGAMAIYDGDGGGVWTSNSGRDAIFHVGEETDDSAVTMPTGYTKKCFLGWVYNNGSSNFDAFIQTGRSRRNATIDTAATSIWTLSGSPERITTVGFLPPRHLIKATIALSGTGTGGAIVAIGDLRATDISSAGDSVGAQVVMSTAITTTIPSVAREVMVQTNAIMAHGTVNANLFVLGYEWD
jgi:hypothetical protein